MAKIKTFPATISVKINTDDPDEHFLSADTDTTGAAFAEDGQKIRIAIYKLDHVRDVWQTIGSAPVKTKRTQ